MKYLLLLLCFLPFLEVNAQETTKDTSWIISNGLGKFYQIARIEYDNGAYSESASLIGDTSALVSLYANQIASAAQTYSSAAVVAMKAQAATSSLAKLDTIMTARLGRSPLTAVAASFEREFLTGTWGMVVGGVTTAVTFPRLSTNQRIRMQPASGGTPRTMLLYGTMLRVVSYPSAGNNTFFKVKDGQWENLARTATLKKTGN